MNITILGYGRMGQIISSLAPQHNINVVSIIDSHHPEATHQSISAEAVAGADVVIDFTVAEGFLDRLRQLAKLQVSVACGTTGWYDSIDEVRNIVEENAIGFLWASNFSIGVHFFWKIIEQASQLVNGLEEYDIFGHEFHHSQKLDSPSGTALTTAETILHNVDRKTVITSESLNRKIEPHELHFTATRGGSVPGTHSVYFDSLADTIEIKHTARGRQGFALGALKAAQWLREKKGFFSAEEWVASIF